MNAIAEIGTQHKYIKALEPVDQLLTLCARINLSSQDRDIIRHILSNGIDFDYVLTKASWHRISTFVTHHLLSTYFQDLVSEDIREKFQQIQYHNLARNIVLQHELARLLALFQGENIDVIVLKGLALLDTIYKDISLRPMSDVDILVEEKNLKQAEELVLTHGYQYRVSQELQDQTRAECRHLANLWHKEKNIMLEVHHHIVSPGEPYYFDISAFRARARTIEISGTTARAFAPEDMLLHLAIKFLLDRRYESRKALGQLCDISEIIKYNLDSMDWDYVKMTVDKNRLASSLHFVLYACGQLLDTPIPSSVLNVLKPPMFGPADAALFIQRRVIDMKLWLAHGLADSKNNDNKTKRGTLTAMFSRLMNAFADIVRNNDSDMQVRKRSFKEIWLRIIQVISKPSEFRKDLYLDRWLHGLQDN